MKWSKHGSGTVPKKRKERGIHSNNVNIFPTTEIIQKQ